MNLKAFKTMMYRKSFFLLLLIPLSVLSLTLNGQIDENCTKIFQLIQKNNIDEIKTLIENDSKIVFCKNQRGSTPLIIATNSDNFDLVKLFVENKAEVNALNNAGNSALSFAALKGNLEIAKYLSESGAKADLKSNNGRYPIHYAAYGGNLDLFRFLLKETDINILDDKKATLIHWAAYGGNVDIFKLLEKNGLNPQIKDADNTSALHWASNKGSVEMLKYLVDELKFDIYEDDGFLDYPMTTALRRDNIEGVNFFLDKGFDIKTKMARGYSVIQMASGIGDVDLIKRLIEMGVDVNTQDNSGSTAINWAAMSGNTEIVDLLLENGAEINPKFCSETMCSDGHSPLHAAAWGSSAMLKYLVNKGANVNIANEFGHTPLINAIRSDSLRNVKILCEAGINVNFADKFGYTALHKSAMLGDVESINILMEYKADIHAKDKQGKTALHYAAINGNNDVITTLLKAGAKIDAKDNSDNTAFYYSVYYGNEKTAETLSINKESISKKLKVKSNLLNEDLAQGESFVWYLNHSGYAIKTKNNLLVFDYWSRGEHTDNASINNGYINPDEIKDLNVTVFASHSHGDHYSTEILEWNDKVKNIKYVIGFEPSIDVNYAYIPHQETEKIGDVEVTTIKSTDGGQAFYVTVDGVSIYHSGDHANFKTDLCEEFSAGIDFLAEKYEETDLVLLPVTGCRFSNRVGLEKGNIHAIEKLKARKVFPMHGTGREWSYSIFADEMKEHFNEDIFFVPNNRGDRVFYSNENLTTSN
jgi:ankyrin repeat protein